MTQSNLFTTGSARFDDTGRFRYEIHRDLGGHKPRVCFIMVNPSKAGADDNDPTVRKCIGFARRFNCGGLSVVNMFAIVSTDKSVLWKTTHADKDDGLTGDPENLATVIRVAKNSELVVAAWGAPPSGKSGAPLVRRAEFVVAMLEQSGAPPLHCLAVTKDGHPHHPLYFPYGRTLQRYRPEILR